jgi:uncharacterized protein (TIGR03083 family)
MTDLNLHPTPPFEVWFDALKSAHARLAELVIPLTSEQLRDPSYDTGWTFADVLSHLGSSAESFHLRLRAGLEGQPSPGNDVMAPIWEVWNAKSPDDQRRDSLATVGATLAEFAALDDSQRVDWELDLFGGTPIDLRDLTRLWLAEHAVHSWDVAVMVDRNALVAADAVELLIDHLSQLVGWAGKPLDQPLVVAVETEHPDRNFVITVNGDGASMSALDARSEADHLLLLPAEAFLRLLYGRLDPEHTPADANDEVLTVMRAVFTGI